MCGDNSVAESTFSTIKNEMYHHRVLTSRVAARIAVMEYIEVRFNRKRPHTAIGGLNSQMVLDWYWEQSSVAVAA